MKKKFIAFLTLVAGDCLAVSAAFVAAFAIRAYALPNLFPAIRERQLLASAYFDRAFMLLLWVSIFWYEKLYTKRHAFWEETRILIKGTSIAFGLITVAVFITKVYVPFSRAIMIMAWLFSMGLLPVIRYAAKSLLLAAGVWKKKVIVIGSTESTAALVEDVARNRTMGFTIVGCLTDDRARVGSKISGVPILGHFDEIERIKDETGFEDIIVTFPNIPRDSLIGLLKKWEGLSDTIRYIPQTGDLITTGIEIENIGKVLALTVRKNLHKPWNVAAKTAFDEAVAVVAVIPLVPVFAAIAAAIKLDSRGPVFFVQERYGKRGKVIKVFKFRSMHVDSRRRLEEFLAENPRANGEWERHRKLLSSDPRLTRVGAVLRRFSIDELPQLFNVLKGEMSLVGPRPYLREELEEFRGAKSLLLQVKPGMTGLWQTSGRSLLPFHERLSLDESYIRNWSLWLDLVILMRTIQVAASGRGAF